MRRLRPLALLSLLLALIDLPGGVTPPAALAAPAAQGPTELTVFAAASLTDAFKEIGRSFEKANPGVKVTFNFAGSQQLAAQLGQGAPADVFASANATQMTVAATANRVAKDVAKTFVQNRLVVITPQDNRARITTLQDLAKPGLKLVLAAKAVPVGQYTLDSYPIAPISDAKQPDLAQKFVSFVFVGDSRLVLAKYGFSLP